MKSSPAKDLNSTSEILMESFLRSASVSGGSTREAWFARQAMLSLMRLVRSEQLLAIQRSVRKLVPEAGLARAAKRSRARRSQRKQPGQTHLAFGREQ